jgi:acyl-CoA synthetase (AMP-forming)/AMP-acid ligase II
VTDAELRAHGLVAPAARVAIPGPVQSVAALLEPPCRSAPDAEALVGRHARYSWAQLDREANRAAHALARLGVRRGERVAASLGNHVEIVVAFLGAMRLGAIWVGVSRVLAPPEKAHILADSGARVLLADREMAAQVGALRGRLPELIHVVDTEPGAPDSEWSARLAAAEATAPDVEIDPFAPAAIAYTSGTTGLPKGAVHSQHNLLMPGAVARARGRSGPEITQGVCLPLTILNLMVLGPILAAQAGSRCVLMDRVDAPGIADWVRRERVSSFASAPATFHDLLTNPEIKPQDLASLTHAGVGGAGCPDELKLLFRERIGHGLLEGYGLTEAPTAVCQTDPDGPLVAGSCGQALPHVRILIQDEQGRELAPGQVGEVCVAPRSGGPWAGVYALMLGYWNQPEASAAALGGGVLHTGDLGCLDAAGNLFIKDRKSELILRGGANVYPAEVERALHEDPRVAHCAVLGVSDRRLGERVVAAVQLEPGASATAEQLQEHCRARLARYKVPERIEFVDAFPRNAMNKILKRELRGLFERGSESEKSG